MKLIAVVVSLACLAFAADKNSAVNGVWRAQMDSLPVLVMTISDEGGDLAGVILFYLIRRDEGQSPMAAPGIPEPLFNLKFDGKALDFRVSHTRSHGTRTANDPPVPFRLRITGPDEACWYVTAKRAKRFACRAISSGSGLRLAVNPRRSSLTQRLPVLLEQSGYENWYGDPLPNALS